MIQLFIEHLNNVLGDSLVQSAKEITYWHQKIKSLYQLKKNNKNIKLQDDLIVMETYIVVHYTIIALATFFRGDFNSNIPVEKRLNLKYLRFVSIEFYKSIFFIRNHNSTLWQKLESVMRAYNKPIMLDFIEEVSQASTKFKDDYYGSESRNIAIHYDFNLDTVYQHLCEINEEEEGKRIVSLLTILHPLNLLCSTYLFSRYPHVPATLSNHEEGIFHKKFREEIYNYVYNQTGFCMEDFANLLHKNMRTYHMIDVPPIKKLLTTKSHTRLSQMRECTKLGILLHYFYLDLGTALRGYLRSENYYEQQLNAIRINVIIYEGYKKIFLPQNIEDTPHSLWETYIKAPMLAIQSPEYLAEVDAIEQVLQTYSKNKNIKDIRHNFSHFKKDKKLSIINLWDDVLSISPIEELTKGLDFLKLINRIIKLNQPCLEYFAYQEHQRSQQEFISSLDELFKKTINSCKSPQDKEKIQRLNKEFRDMVLNTLDKITQANQNK